RSDDVARNRPARPRSFFARRALVRQAQDYYSSAAPPVSNVAFKLLELKLERKLDRARSADLVERVETAVRAPGAQTVGQRLSRAAEHRAGQAVDRVGEIRVVEDVEELGPETKPGPLCNPKDSLEGNIGLRRPEAPQDVPAKIPLRPDWGRSKRSTVE